MYCKNFKTRKKNNKKEKRIYNYCITKRKEITYEDCKECKFKEYIQKKPKQCVKIQNNNTKIHSNVKKSLNPSKTKKNDGIKKKTAKLSYLERNRTSLFTDDLNHCIICGKPNVNLHEIFYGSKHRQLSIKYKLVIPLCNQEHHNQIEKKGIHFNKNLCNEWHKKGQLAFIANYPDLDFLSIFHRNYL